MNENDLFKSAVRGQFLDITGVVGCPSAIEGNVRYLDDGLMLINKGRIEWFGDIVVRPKLEADDPLRIFSFGSEHDHRQGEMGADLSEHLQSVLVRQHEVQNDHVGRL